MNDTRKRPLGVEISHMLRERGGDVIFGIPGVHNQELYRGIEEAGLRHVLARNEQGAGFMADGYARATGRPGLAYVITGPGLCNIMNPMGQAYSDSIPMLVISSCLDETSARRGQLHQMRDQEAAARTVCDWSETAHTAQAAYELIDRAFLEFRTKRARPKHIQVPISVLEGAADGFAPGPGRVAALPDVPPRSGMAPELFGRLSEARRPLFVLGGGVKGRPEVAQILSTFGAACFLTYAGRGLVAPDYALNFGATLARTESAEIVAQADLVIAVGTELSEVDLWRDQLGETAQLVRVDIDPEVLADAHVADLAICADAATLFAELAEACADAAHETTGTLWNAQEVRAHKARWRAQADAERPGIAALIDALWEAAPRDAMIFSDMTQFAYLAKEIYPMDRPDHWHHPSGFGTLGYALPAAIGGKIGVGDQPVISINGDSGFQYNIQELATAVELELSLPIIVWDNGKLKEIEDSMTRAQIAPNAVIARNPDFSKLAEAYGAQARAPRSIAEFKRAIGDALSNNGPTLIHITPETGAQ